MTQHNIRNTEAILTAPDPRVAFFDALAPHWDRDCSHPEETLKRLAALAALLGLEPEMSVLELGCGTGQITGWLTEQVAPGRVVAVDFSPGMLREASRRKVRAEFRLLDICAQTAGAGEYDLVLCFNCFPHFRDPRAALVHINEGLKPGGRLLILHLIGSARLNAFHGGLKAPVCHDRLPGAGEWPDLLSGTGLKAECILDREDLFLVKAKAQRR